MSITSKCRLTGGSVILDLLRSTHYLHDRQQSYDRQEVARRGSIKETARRGPFLLPTYYIPFTFSTILTIT